jgi:hypothetical protein
MEGSEAMALKHSASKNGCAYSILTDTDNRPTALIGRVMPQSTRGRGLPPNPNSGFVTAYTPFDRGHIMALELNGPDISENIVPQYRMWQQTGSWRKVEVELEKDPKAPGAIFAVVLSYPAHPDTDAAQRARFSLYEIFDWTDKRIPDSFDIWFIAKTQQLAKYIEQTLLTDQAADEKAFGDCLTQLRNKTPHKTFDHSKMPPEDVATRKLGQVGLAFHSAFDTYKEQRTRDVKKMEDELSTNPVEGLSKKQEKEAIDVTRSPLRSEVEFAMTQGGPIKQELQTTYGWTSTETVALNGGKVVEAAVENRGARAQKTFDKQHTLYIVGYDKARKKKDKLAQKGVPYPAGGYSGTNKF